MARDIILESGNLPISYGKEKIEFPDDILTGSIDLMDMVSPLIISYEGERIVRRDLRGERLPNSELLNINDVAKVFAEEHSWMFFKSGKKRDNNIHERNISFPLLIQAMESALPNVDKTLTINANNSDGINYLEILKEGIKELKSNVEYIDNATLSHKATYISCSAGSVSSPELRIIGALRKEKSSGSGCYDGLLESNLVLDFSTKVSGVPLKYERGLVAKISPKMIYENFSKYDMPELEKIVGNYMEESKISLLRDIGSINYNDRTGAIEISYVGAYIEGFSFKTDIPTKELVDPFNRKCGAVINTLNAMNKLNKEASCNRSKRLGRMVQSSK